MKEKRRYKGNFPILEERTRIQLNVKENVYLIKTLPYNYKHLQG